MWEQIATLFAAYRVGEYISAPSAANAAAQSPGTAVALLLLLGLALTCGLVLCFIVICNIACCSALFGIAAGFSCGRGRASHVPEAVGESVALAGEVAAYATGKAAQAGRQRLAGYRHLHASPSHVAVR